MSRPSIGSKLTVLSHWHSSAHGEAATRGGLTSRDGAGSSPVCCISLWPRGSGAEVPFIWSRRSKVARLQTNSLVSSTKATESFGPSLENITIGGLSVMPLKNEYGARLISPFVLMEVIQPIGRGATIALNGLYGRPWSFLRVS